MLASPIASSDALSRFTTVCATCNLNRCILPRESAVSSLFDSASLIFSFLSLAPSDAPKYFLFNGSSRNEAVHGDGSLLPRAMRAIHCLEVAHRVPVVIQEHDNVCTRQIESQATDCSGQHEQLEADVPLKRLGNPAALHPRHSPVDPSKLQFWKVWPEHAFFDGIQRVSGLGKQEHSVEATRDLQGVVRLHRVPCCRGGTRAW